MVLTFKFALKSGIIHVMQLEIYKKQLKIGGMQPMELV